MKKIFTLLLALFIGAHSHAQSTFRVSCTATSPLFTPGYIVNAGDGGFTFAATTNVLGAGFDDFYLLHTDGNGNLLWTKTFGGPVDDVARAMASVSDGGYIITGSTSSFG